MNKRGFEKDAIFDDTDQKNMLEKCKEHNKIPVFYAYVIAFEARVKNKLLDCDVVLDGVNLCTDGSCFIKESRDHLINVYSYHANEISKIMDKDATVIFLMEPDFW